MNVEDHLTGINIDNINTHQLDRLNTNCIHFVDV